MVWVGMRVCPMGWLLAVRAMQSAGRRLAGEAPPVGAGLYPFEHAGSQPIPVPTPLGVRMWYSIYLNNWYQFTIGDQEAFEAAQRRPSPEQLALREAWARVGVNRNPAKTIEAATSSDCLGGSH